MVRNCNIMVRNGQCMVRNGNSLVRNGNLIYGTKWLWYEMTVYRLNSLTKVKLVTLSFISIMNIIFKLPRSIEATYCFL